MTPVGRVFVGSDLERPNVQHERNSGVRRWHGAGDSAHCARDVLLSQENYILLHDSRDPLVKQGGLKPSQEIKR